MLAIFTYFDDAIGYDLIYNPTGDTGAVGSQPCLCGPVVPQLPRTELRECSALVTVTGDRPLPSVLRHWVYARRDGVGRMRGVLGP